MADFEKIANCVIEGEDEDIVEIINGEIAVGTDPLKILNDGLIAGMMVVSERFRADEIFLPEVLMAAEAMNAGIDVVRPLIGDADVSSKETVVIGTVKGDLHDIGKNIVVLMLETAGYKVINLGCDVAPETIIASIKENKPRTVGMSALLTTSMTVMKKTIELAKKEGVRDAVKFIIGGVPTSWDFCRSIGADGFSADAAGTVELCDKLMA